MTDCIEMLFKIPTCVNCGYTCSFSGTICRKINAGDDGEIPLGNNLFWYGDSIKHLTENNFFTLENLGIYEYSIDVEIKSESDANLGTIKLIETINDNIVVCDSACVASDTISNIHLGGLLQVYDIDKLNPHKYSLIVDDCLVVTKCHVIVSKVFNIVAKPQPLGYNIEIVQNLNKEGV